MCVCVHLGLWFVRSLTWAQVQKWSKLIPENVVSSVTPKTTHWRPVGATRPIGHETQQPQWGDMQGRRCSNVRCLESRGADDDDDDDYDDDYEDDDDTHSFW